MFCRRATGGLRFVWVAGRRDRGAVLRVVFPGRFDDEVVERRMVFRVGGVGVRAVLDQGLEDIFMLMSSLGFLGDQHVLVL